MNAIYARQSIDKKDSLSIEGQIAACRRSAGDDAIIFQDRGFSGKNTNRPAFTELIHAVEEGSVQKIYVYRLDRFSRSIADFSRLWELLEQCGTAFQSVTEQFDTASPMGRAMLNIILVFAQLERETTAERVRDNYMHRFSLGVWPGGPAPFGFTISRKILGGRSVSILIPNESAAVVQKIFKDYAESGLSLRALAKKLNTEGIHGPKRDVWDNVTLSRLLRSPLYVRADDAIYYHYLALGVAIEQDIRAFDGRHACQMVGRRPQGSRTSADRRKLTLAVHEGIIDSALFLKAQEKLSENSQLPRTNAGKYSWLTGLLKCGLCGYAIKINYDQNKETFHLVCSGKSNLNCCSASLSLDLHELEAAVAVEISAVLRECLPEICLPKSRSLAVAVLDTEKRIERLVSALSESNISATHYITREIERLDRMRENLLCQNPAPKSQQILFDTLSFDEKKLVAAQLIERVLLTEDQVCIHWKF